MLFFPQLIAGPIIRYRDIAAQLAARAHRPAGGFALGVRRFVIGLAKKMLMANIVARSGRRDLRAAAPASSPPRSRGSASSATRCRSTSTSPATRTWRSAWAACSASASRRTSATPTSRVGQDFWRRWHISLSHLVPRLPLHPARRQPASRRARDVPEPGDRVLPVRAVARRELDVRGLGPVPRRVPGARAPAAWRRVARRRSRARCGTPTRCWS